LPWWLNVILAHDLSPARDFGVQQRLRGLRRALILGVRHNTGGCPGFDDRGIVLDLFTLS
jgi:hypothetical protein